MSVVAIIGVLIIALVGCTQPGYLEVENDTGEVIWVSIGSDTEEEVAKGGSISEEWELQATPLESEQLEVDISIRGIYKQIEDDTAVVTAGETTTYTVDADGGAIRINNNSSYNLYGIYITPSSNSNWGANLLSSALPPSYYFRYFGLAPGSWDVRLQDASFNYDSYGYTVSVGVTRVISFVDAASAPAGFTVSAIEPDYAGTTDVVSDQSAGQELLPIE